MLIVSVVSLAKCPKVMWTEQEPVDVFATVHFYLTRKAIELT
jgi:hypothetical protein